MTAIIRQPRPRTLSKRSLDNLAGVHPHLIRIVNRALQSSPVDFTVIEGLRTLQRQRELFSQGYTQTLSSRHFKSEVSGYGNAVDLWPIDPDTGRLVPGRLFDANGRERENPRLWELYHILGPAVKAAAKAEELPIQWGGDWKSFKDGPHYQLPRNLYP
jgi:peptidoglycan LD-endopeptidase CwlK